MKRRISFRHLILAAVAVFGFSRVGYSDPLIIAIPAPGVNIFVFQNVQPQVAFDFHVILINPLGPPPLAIGGGFGGAPFPNTIFGPGLPGGGFISITFTGGPGVAPRGMYSVSFPNWPVGTQFSVSFSYIIDGEVVFFDPSVIQVVRPPEGQIGPVPEPTTLLLLGTGLTGVAIKTRKRLKNRKSG